jgi:AsmA protein
MSASTNQTAVPDVLKANTQGPTMPTETGVIVIPGNFDLQFHAVADKVNFQDLILEKINGNMLINNGKLIMKNNSFDVVGSNVKMDIVYGSETPNRANFDFKILAKDFDVNRAYKEVKLFREMASAAENAEGIISLDYKVAGKLDGNMQPIYPSLVGGGTLSVKKVKMKGFKMFGAVSRKTGKDAMKNPDLSQVDIKTKIKNNIINIERFKFKVAGFRPRIEGQTSFDGNLNIKMRLGLPPFGLFGIPIKVTGTKDNPIVRLGKQTEDLKETEYDEGQAPVQTPATTPQTTN